MVQKSTPRVLFRSASVWSLAKKRNDDLAVQYEDCPWLNFGKRYKDDLRVIFDQWPKLHLGLDALSNQKIVNGI